MKLLERLRGFIGDDTPRQVDWCDLSSTVKKGLEGMQDWDSVSPQLGRRVNRDLHGPKSRPREQTPEEASGKWTW